MTSTNGHIKQMVLDYGQSRIQYGLKRSNRRDLAITVHPDQSVEVTAPLDAEIDTIQAKVRRRAKWITRQIVFFEPLQPLPKGKQYVNGETHKYLGRQYRLRVLKSDASRVRLMGRFIEVETSSPQDSTVIERAVCAWYRHRAEDVFGRVADLCHKIGKPHRVPQSRFSIRRMKRRWGSCSAAGQILLNPDLMMTPMVCVEYVVMHEMCHLEQMNHGPAFYRLLSRCMPDWEVRKKRLNEFVP